MLALLALLASSLLSGAAAHPLVVFNGNLVITEDVYRTALDLPPDTAPTRTNARLVALRVRAFLRRSGYELAVVRARVIGDQIVVDMDEGRLDKIVIIGGGSFETVRAKLEVGLPSLVFNRPQLERELARLSARYHLAALSYEVAPVHPNGEQPGKTLSDELTDLQDLPFFRPGSAQELHIFLDAGKWGKGFSPRIQIDSLQGGGFGGEYHNGDLLFHDDRWLFEGLAAGAIRQHLDVDSSYAVLSRAAASGRYYGPSLGLAVLRPSLGLRVDLLDRQRGDLHLDRFDFLSVAGTADLQLDLARGLVVLAGLGYERRVLFGLRPGIDVAPIVAATPRAQSRALADLGIHLTFNPDELRLDRKHSLDLDVSWFSRGAADRPSSFALRGRYQKVFLLGWHELWLEGLGSFRDGDVFFSEEEAVGGGDALRGPFGGESVRKLLVVGTEFRYSLWRDNFKLGFFDRVATYGTIDRTTNRDTVAGADALGLGLHALIIDQFQIDAYFSVGFSNTGKFDRGAALSIRQVF